MSETVIQVEGLGKKYTIGHQQQGGYKTLRDAIASSAKSLKNRILSPNSQNIPSKSYEEFWALKDVSFEVKQGEVVGIIGRNGAGKSTLLKILSRITEPTTGEVRIKGRVASLLEVGTGFHPELTGRENIFLNGAILGMSKVEIRKKFDEIVDFAEVEKFLDTPVKHYSSGMYVRLAFAVAAHLEPEILIVDEVLAVGDAQFQKKCLGKIGEVAHKEGRTILFVSHNMTALKSLCDRALLLKSGYLSTNGEPSKIISQYLGDIDNLSQLERRWDCPETAPGNNKIRLSYIAVVPEFECSILDPQITVETPLRVECEYWNYLDDACLNLSLHVNNLEGVCIFNSVSSPVNLRSGLVKGICFIPGNFFNDESYQVTMMIVQDTSVPLYTFENIVSFTVNDVARKGNWYGKWVGVVRPKFDWKLIVAEEGDRVRA